MLPIDCTAQDVENANIETIYNSFHKDPGYPYEIIMEMAYQLCLCDLCGL